MPLRIDIQRSEAPLDRIRLAGLLAQVILQRSASDPTPACRQPRSRATVARGATTPTDRPAPTAQP